MNIKTGTRDKDKRKIAKKKKRTLVTLIYTLNANILSRKSKLPHKL